MTYKQIAEIISKMSEKQKNYDALVYNVDMQECYNIDSLQPIPDEEVYGSIVPADDNPVFCI